MLRASQDMNTELYKNLKLSVRESATLLVVIDKSIEHYNKNYNFFWDRLNGAGTEKQAKDWSDGIKHSRKRLKELNSIKAKIEESEVITKHQLA